MKKILYALLLCALPISNAANLSATTKSASNKSTTSFQPIAGIHYRDIKQTVAVSNNSIIFLWYGCNSCLQLELQFAANNPSWQRFPVSLYKSWRPQTKLYYTIRSLKIDEGVELKLMKALVDGAIDEDDLDAQKNSILSSLISESDIDDIYYSKVINQQSAFSDTLTRQLNIQHVPAALITGKYYLDLSMVSGLQQFVDTIHFLEQLEQQQNTLLTEGP